MKFRDILAIASISFLIISCKTKNEKDIVKDDFSFAEKQFTLAMHETDSIVATDKNDSLIVPRSIDKNGNLTLITSSDWCSGFFPGSLWYMYEYTQNKKWEQAARKYTDPLEPEKNNRGTHDTGFMMYCSFGNGYRLTKDNKYKQILLQTAKSLSSRYYPKAKIIRSWDFDQHIWQCPVIIDNMMNLELLFWAFSETKDSTYYNIAVNHAKTTMKNHFREDYSSYHVVDYDTITGNVRLKQTHQGYSDNSAWSRGQAWGIYGYTMCFRETKLPEFLEQAKHIANFIFSNPNMPEDLIPYWDFDAPNIPNEPKDVSAATVTASALYELSLYDKENAVQYKKWADTIIENLSSNYLAKVNGDHGFLLLHSTGAKMYDSEIDVPLSYADYYFLEALLRKQKLEQTGKIF
ncbi:MAG: glycoside hydrolase family 88 protein [Dysgonomonas sp.]